jgi:hypothetical protein
MPALPGLFIKGCNPTNAFSNILSGPDLSLPLKKKATVMEMKWRLDEKILLLFYKTIQKEFCKSFTKPGVR